MPFSWSSLKCHLPEKPSLTAIYVVILFHRVPLFSLVVVILTLGAYVFLPISLLLSAFLCVSPLRAGQCLCCHNCLRSAWYTTDARWMFAGCQRERAGGGRETGPGGRVVGGSVRDHQPDSGPAPTAPLRPPPSLLCASPKLLITLLTSRVTHESRKRRRKMRHRIAERRIQALLAATIPYFLLEYWHL